MHHLREADSDKHTVIMIQIEIDAIRGYKRVLERADRPSPPGVAVSII